MGLKIRKLDIVKLLKASGMLPIHFNCVKAFLHPQLPEPSQFYLNFLELSKAIFGIDSKPTKGPKFTNLHKLLGPDKVLSFSQLVCQPKQLNFTSSQKQQLRLHFRDFRIVDRDNVFILLLDIPARIDSIMRLRDSEDMKR